MLTQTLCGHEKKKKAQILPFHGDFPFARFFRVHIVKASSVVVWISATKDQLSTWGVFGVPTKA